MKLEVRAPSVSRPLWSNKFEGLVVMMGYSMGISIVFMFSYLFFRFGGSAFIIPYLIGLVFLGFPMLVLQMTVGQFCSRSFLSSRSFSPITRGLGICMLLANLVLLAPYTYIQGFFTRYLALSMSSTPPWASCDNHWNTESCVERYDPEGNVANASVVDDYYGHPPLQITPAEEYFHHVLGGGFQWGVLLGCLFVLVLAFAALILGVRSLGKVAYVTLVLPFVLLLILLIRAVTLPGAADGLRYLLYPNFNRLASLNTWANAFSLVFAHTGVNGGIYVSLASFNRFHNNILRDAFVVTATSVFACAITSLMIFCFIGFGAQARNVSINEVAESGLGLVCVALLDVFQKIPASGFWSFLILLFTFLLGFGTLCPMILNITAQLVDIVGQLKILWTILLTLGVCAVVFVANIFSCAWPNLPFFLDAKVFTVFKVAALAEVISVGWFYGGHRMAAHYKVMTGCKSFQMVCKIWAIIMWCFLTPICLLVMILDPIIYMHWQSWLFLLAFSAPIPAYGIYYCLRYGMGKSLREVMQPAPEWRPASERHWQEAEMEGTYEHQGRAGVVLMKPVVTEAPTETAYEPKA